MGAFCQTRRAKLCCWWVELVGGKMGAKILVMERQEMRYKCWPLHFSSQPLRVEKKNIYVGQGNKRIPGVASEDSICDWEEQCCFHNSGPCMAWGQWSSNGWRRYSVKQMWRKLLQSHIDLIVNKELRMIRLSHNVDSKVLRGWSRKRHRFRTGSWWVWDVENEGNYTDHNNQDQVSARCPKYQVSTRKDAQWPPDSCYTLAERDCLTESRGRVFLYVESM